MGDPPLSLDWSDKRHHARPLAACLSCGRLTPLRTIAGFPSHKVCEQNRLAALGAMPDVLRRHQWSTNSERR